jgi:hypothetical protein
MDPLLGSNKHSNTDLRRSRIVDPGKGTGFDMAQGLRAPFGQIAAMRESLCVDR